MEFGIFFNGYIPGPAAHDTELEHTELFNEAKFAVFADKHKDRKSTRLNSGH